MKVSREQKAKCLALAGIAPEPPADRGAPDLISPHVEVRADGSVVFDVPCVVPSLANERQWQQRNRVAQSHRRAVSRALGPHLRLLAPFAEHYHANRPLAVLLTRLGGGALDRSPNKHERFALESGRLAGLADALAESGEDAVVQVVNVRGLTGDRRAGVVYCGRRCAGWAGHPLANPFKLGRDSDRDECIAKYRAWLLARPTLDADLAALWEQTRRGELPLGCWCAPELCHASVLAELLAERFGGEG